MRKNNISIVLVAPLDWGLGHATRCIPIIKALQYKGYQVIVAATKQQETLLKQELSNIVFIPTKGYNIQYSNSAGLLPFKLMVQLPGLLFRIIQEYFWLQKIIVDHKIDWVISDNRFGLFTNKIPCVFITHQLLIKTPFQWLEKWIQHINYFFINKYTVCWVPDVEKNGLAGELSHPKKRPNIPVHYIGLLSRFTQLKLPKSAYTFDGCFLISGPEPQRSILNNIALNTINEDEKWVIVQGKPSTQNNAITKGNLHIIPHLQGKKLTEIIYNSELIVCRSGYTSLMELVSLHKKAILIPTPGQTEQQYLAEYLQNIGLFTYMHQSEINEQKLTEAKAILFKQKNSQHFTFFDEARLATLLEVLG